jgi:hypothetical protein
MGAIEDLKAADTLQFARINFHMRTPFNELDSRTMPFCLTKPRGTLSFTLTSAQLNLPIPGLSFPFIGTADASGQVTWRVDQSVDLWYSAVHITRVHGQIVTQLGETRPRLGNACDGTQRVFKATLVTAGNDNTLVVDTSLGSATASNITTQVAAGSDLAPVFFNLGISADHWDSDGCGRQFQLQGSTVRLTAVVRNLVATGTVTSITYQWQPPIGAAVIGPTDQPTLTLLCSQPGQVTAGVRVIVTTDVESGSTQATLRFATLNADEAQLLALLCRIRSATLPTPNVVVTGIGPGATVGGIRFVDPLWDPSPEMLREPDSVLVRTWSRYELHQLRHAVDRLTHDAAALLKHTARVIELREAEALGDSTNK